jgi:hypothetical protein
MLSSAAFAQTKTIGPTARPRPATLSGRVFAITRSGDLKPARMASIYLFLDAPPKRADDEDFMYFEMLREALKAAQAETEATDVDNAEWARGGWTVSEDYMQQHWCVRKLRLSRQTLHRTIAWAEAHHKMSEVLVTEADEEGNFQLTVPRPGAYYVFASGQAGFNDALWGGWPSSGSPNRITVDAGSSYNIKLSSPETACLITEQAGQ